MHLDRENDRYSDDPVARAAALGRARQTYDQRAITRLWRPEVVIVAAALFIAVAIGAGVAHAWGVMVIGLVALIYPVSYFVDWRRRSR